MKQDEILKKYRRYLIANDKSRVTIKNYMIGIRQAMDFKKKNPEDWTMDDLYDIKEYLKDKYEQNSLISKISSINNLMKCLKGEKTELRLKIPPSISKNKDVFTEKEIAKMIQVTKRYPRDNAIILTLIHTGVRHQEILNLNTDDILWEEQKIKINKGKGNTYDIINIKQEALDGIKAYLDDEERPTPKKGYEKALFLSSHKRRLGYTTLHRIIKEAGVKAGIKRRVYPHMFRASMLTFMDKNGASVFEIKAQSRHKQIKTVERYVRHSDEHNKKVYNRTMPEFNGKTEKEPTSNQDNPDIVKQLLDRIKGLETQLKQNNNKTDYIQ